MPTTTAITTLPLTPINPHQFSVPKQRLIPTASNKWPSFSSSTTAVTLTKSPFITLPLSATSNSTSVVEEQLQEEGNLVDQSEPTDLIPLGGCKACGKEEIERGCNGEGRIQGGIATVPGFGWWPIKAYRPCPGFVASGGRYRRQGQSMDEVAGFGSVKRVAPKVPTDEAQSSKKEGPRKFRK